MEELVEPGTNKLGGGDRGARCSGREAGSEDMISLQLVGVCEGKKAVMQIYTLGEVVAIKA